jgi:hypothetical protein
MSVLALAVALTVPGSPVGPLLPAAGAQVLAENPYPECKHIRERMIKAHGHRLGPADGLVIGNWWRGTPPGLEGIYVLCTVRNKAGQTWVVSYHADPVRKYESISLIPYQEPGLPGPNDRP